MQVASPASLAAQAQAELITQPLYAGKLVANGDSQTVLFDGTTAGNRLITNVDQNGTLPHPKFFRVGGFRYHPLQAMVAGPALDVPAKGYEDMLALTQCGWFEFKIGDLKPYLQCPLLFLPSGMGVQGHGFSNITAAATEFGYALTNGQPRFDNFLRIKHWISIPPLQSFQARIGWVGDAVTATFTTTTAIKLNNTAFVWVFLDGEYGREVL